MTLEGENTASGSKMAPTISPLCSETLTLLPLRGRVSAPCPLEAVGVAPPDRQGWVKKGLPYLLAHPVLEPWAPLDPEKSNHPEAATRRPRVS